MTDKFNYLTVILEKDMREDDAEALIDAIKQLRNVLDVIPNVRNADSVVALEKARAEFTDRLFELLQRGKPNATATDS